MSAGRICIQIAADRLTASVTISKGDSESLEQLNLALVQAGVSHGIDEDTREQLGHELADEDFQAPQTIIATGSPPEVGEDGRLELRFESDITAGTERADGSLDLRDRGTLQPVSLGDSIALRHPPGAGTAGCGVDGKSLEAAPGKDDPTAVGAGATEDARGEITATQNGVIQFQAHRLIDVTDHHVHSGDVDVRSGHLTTKGSLTVQGDVLTGYAASAAVDVEVTGQVDGGSVLAGGNISVSGGLIGGEAGHLSAEGNVEVKHIQNGAILCGGDLGVSADSVGGALQCRNARLGGRMLGGSLEAEETISVDQAGSAMGTGTRLSAAQALERPVVAALASVNAAREKRGARGPQSRGPRGRSSSGSSGRRKRSAEKGAHSHQQELIQRRIKLLAKAHIDVRSTLHPGVKIEFGIHKWTSEETTAATRFRWDASAGRITLAELEA